MSHHSSITLGKKSKKAIKVPEGLQYEQVSLIIEKLRMMITIQGVDLPPEMRDAGYIREQILDGFGDEPRLLKLLLSNDFGQGYLMGLIVAYNADEMKEKYEKD